MPRWKGLEHDNKYPATHETYGIAKTEGIPIMKPNADQPKAPESKPGSKPNAKDDLKSLPLPEVGRDQRRQTGVNRAGAREDVHYANGPK
jgi:hypothetical protein